MMNVHFIRVRDGLVLEKGWTDLVAFAVMQAEESEYRPVTRTQHDTLNLGDDAPPEDEP